MRSAPAASPTPPAPVGAGRAFTGGFFMGLANLVPGVSGGTMILVVGLYDAFIQAVADLTGLRWSRRLFAFLVVFGVGLVLAVLTLAGPAVWLVVHHRWIAYSLFIGMTLGGVPELMAAVRPARALELGLALLGLAVMVPLWPFLGLADISLAINTTTLLAMGALASACMILPGISGSFLLLVVGFYGTVIGCLDPRVFTDDPLGTLRIATPFGIGVIAGIGLVSNVLERLLARFSAPTHAALLGLLLGSIPVLYPFQHPLHPELDERATRKAIERLAAGASSAEIEAEHGVVWTSAERARLEALYAGLAPDELKRMSMEAVLFAPSGGQSLLVVVLLAGGYLLTRVLAPRQQSPPQ